MAKVEKAENTKFGRGCDSQNPETLLEEYKMAQH